MGSLVKPACLVLEAFGRMFYILEGFILLSKRRKSGQCDKDNGYIEKMMKGLPEVHTF